jgi:uncharacterized membrane protein
VVSIASGNRALALGLTAAALLWLVVLIAAPLFVSRGAASPAIAAIYAAAGLVCHQRPERSFTIAGMQMPVCARCFGLYAAGAAGALAASVVAAGTVRGGSREVRIVLAVAAAPTAVTIALEWFGLAFPSNTMRAAASLPLGAAAGWTFVRLLHAPSRTFCAP